MRKILFIWDSKNKAADINLKNKLKITLGVISKDNWEMVSNAALMVDARDAGKVERVFKEFGVNVEWKKFEVEIASFKRVIA